MASDFWVDVILVGGVGFYIRFANQIPRDPAGCVIDELNDFVQKSGNPTPGFLDVGEECGGGRMINNVSMGSFRNVCIRSFVQKFQEVVRSLPNAEQQKSQMFIRRQEDDKFEEIFCDPAGAYHK